MSALTTAVARAPHGTPPDGLEGPRLPCGGFALGGCDGEPGYVCGFCVDAWMARESPARAADAGHARAGGAAP